MNIICDAIGVVWYRALGVISLMLLGAVTVGCATTETNQLQPKAMSAVAKSGNTYVVQRAAVRTASTVRKQHQRTQYNSQIQQRPTASAKRATQPRRFPGQLTVYLSSTRYRTYLEYK